MNQTLANHSYVDISLVGRPYYDGEGVQCITDLATCSSQGSHRGDWYFPDGTRLPFSGNGDTYQQRASQRVYLGCRNNPTLVSIAVIFQLVLSMIIMTSQ